MLGGLGSWADILRLEEIALNVILIMYPHSLLSLVHSSHRARCCCRTMRIRPLLQLELTLLLCYHLVVL
jgi:hypothetical protein